MQQVPSGAEVVVTNGPRFAWGSGLWLALAAACAGDTDPSDKDSGGDTGQSADADADSDADADADADADSDADTDPLGCVDVDAGSTVPVTVTGTTLGEPNDFDPSCSYSVASDQAVLYTAPSAGLYAFDTLGSAFDTTLTVLDGCDGVELGCSDDISYEQGIDPSRVIVDLAAGQQVIVVVDGYYVFSGAYALNVALTQATETACTDGVDDDLDLLTDCLDPDCGAEAACLAQCPDAVTAGFPVQLAGTTRGQPDEFTGSCDGQQVSTPDASIAFTAPGTGTFGFALTTTGTDFDAVLYALDSCGGTELACSERAGNGGESLELGLTAGQTIEIIVDGLVGATGDFELVVDLPNPTEDCTDGFDDDFDGDPDCFDADCDDAPSCAESCANGVDDDGDLLSDCFDDDCQLDAACTEYCTNGTDDDGDGLLDCEDPYCNADAACPEDCVNRIDDDGDHLTDCLDPWCELDAACAPVCPEDTLTGALPIAAGGSTLGLAADHPVSCAGGASDASWEFVAPADGDYTFDTIGSSYDTALAVLTSCAGAELACNDDRAAPTDLTSEVTVPMVAGQRVIVVVTGYSALDSGDYVLNVR